MVFCFFYVPDYKSNICPLWKVYNEHKITKGRKRAGYKSAWMFWIHLHIMFLYIYKERQRSTGRKREEDWERKKDAWGCSRKCLYWLSSWFLDSPLHFSFYAVWIFSRINLCYFFKTKFFFFHHNPFKIKIRSFRLPLPLKPFKGYSFIQEIFIECVPSARLVLSPPRYFTVLTALINISEYYSL